MDTALPSRFWAVGDLHGRRECFDYVRDNAEFAVFVGDYLDSFDRPVTDQLSVLADVLRMVGAGKAKAILGNHEWSYLRYDMRCSGFNGRTADLLLPLEMKMLSYASPFLLNAEHRCLVTHAGVSRQHEAVIDEASLLAAYGQQDSWWWSIGRARGGWSEAGGPLWCDWDREFVPIPGLTQIFGHTRYSDWRLTGEHLANSRIRFREKNFNIDCLEDDPYVLEVDLEKGVFKPIRVGESH